MWTFSLYQDALILLPYLLAIFAIMARKIGIEPILYNFLYYCWMRLILYIFNYQLYHRHDSVSKPVACTNGCLCFVKYSINIAFAECLLYVPIIYWKEKKTIKTRIGFNAFLVQQTSFSYLTHLPSTAYNNTYLKFCSSFFCNLN